MADGEDQGHKEGTSEICLLDGILERGRKDAKCASRELCKDGPGRGSAEGQGYEEGSLRVIIPHVWRQKASRTDSVRTDTKKEGEGGGLRPFSISRDFADYRKRDLKAP